MLGEVALMVSAILFFTRCTMCVAGMTVPAMVRIGAAFVLSHQAGSFVNALATYGALQGNARFKIALVDILPFVGWLKSTKKLTGGVRHAGLRNIFDAQIGFVAEGLFYVLVGAATFGWQSVAGWPIAILGLLVSVLARPWMDALGIASSDV